MKINFFFYLGCPEIFTNFFSRCFFWEGLHILKEGEETKKLSYLLKRAASAPKPSKFLSAVKKMAFFSLKIKNNKFLDCSEKCKVSSIRCLSS